MATILSETIWNPDKNVWILNGPVFEWLGLAVVKDKAGPFENPTIWNPDHLNSDLQKVQILNGRISDPYCIFIYFFGFTVLCIFGPLVFHLFSHLYSVYGPS